MFAGAFVTADDAFNVLIFDVLLTSVLGVHTLGAGSGALLKRQELLFVHGSVLGDCQAAGVVLRTRRRR